MKMLKKRVPLFLKLLASTGKYCFQDIRQRQQASHFCSVFPTKGLKWNPIKTEFEVLNHKSTLFCKHRFDLLGSGWCCFDRRENKSPSLAPACRHYSKKILKYVSSDYSLIDWGCDVKSGYHWAPMLPAYWHALTISKSPEGADIKIPWELARLQHLPQIAAFAAFSPEEKAQSLWREYCNEILDFIASNPVGTGVNWVCPMDIGIRAANILLAYHIFTSARNNLDAISDLEKILSSSMKCHADYIIRNLEYSPATLPGNHYLSDIAGLLFISAYLPPSEETDHYLYFAIQELFRMIKMQFYPDGSNYESSSCYHCLCAEIAMYSTALLLGLSEERLEKISNLVIEPGLTYSAVPVLPHEEQEYSVKNGRIAFPAWYTERLDGMAAFAVALTKPNHELVQIGDNDSGHFFRLSLRGQWLSPENAEKRYANLAFNKGNLPHDMPYWDENMLDYTHILKVRDAICENTKEDSSSLEAMVAVMLSHGNKITFHSKSRIASPKQGDAFTKDESLDFRLEKTLIPTQFAGSHSILYHENGWCFVSGETEEIKTDHPLTDGLQLYSFPDSNVFIFRSSRLFFAVYAVPITGTGGHSHNDKMNVEINIDGKNIVSDPGSYCYTAHPSIRNIYRSTRAHCVATTTEEPNKMTSLFAMQQESRTVLRELTNTHLKLETRYRNVIHCMEATIYPDRIYFLDSANVPLKHNFSFQSLNYSNGYGKRKNTKSQD